MGLKPILRGVGKEPGSCAVFGAISYGRDRLSGRLAVEAISAAADWRGGTDGNGVAFASTRRGERGKVVSVLSTDHNAVDDAKRKLSKQGIDTSAFQWVGVGDIFQARTTAEYLPLLFASMRVNAEFGLDGPRIISAAHGISVYKGLPHIDELDRLYSLSGQTTDAMVAHTRYPTGSAPLAIRAHPYSFGNVAIVHNGDVTSYRSNLNATESLLAEMYYRSGGDDVESFLRAVKKSWVGTDSEVIAAMLYLLLKSQIVSDSTLSVPEIVEVLTSPRSNQLTKLLRGSAERMRKEDLLSRFAGFGLDGPVTALSLIAEEGSSSLLAFRDRNEFRPMTIVVDHQHKVVYVASELQQIEAAAKLDVYSPTVEVYPLEPGKYLLVSTDKGILSSGRTDRPFIPRPATNGIHISGHIGQFSGDRVDAERIYHGTLGSYGASYTSGVGSFELYGCAEQNAFEASSIRQVIIHGNVSMMFGNSYKGQVALVRGRADTRAFQQLRPYAGHEPVAIIGENAGTYAFKMMSGGVGMVLGLSQLGREDRDTPFVGEFLGTGMVGGRIYVRGNVPDTHIKRPALQLDIIAHFADLKDQALISEDVLREIRHNPFGFERVKRLLENDPISKEHLDKILDHVSPLYDPKLHVERRTLNPEEISVLGPHLRDFVETFNCPDGTLQRLETSEYTIVSVK